MGLKVRLFFLMVVLVMVCSIIPGHSNANVQAEARSAQQGTFRSYLPVVIVGDRALVRPSGGQCAPGTHLIHNSGELGIVDPDTGDYADADYTCEVDDSLAAITCSSRGTPYLLDGVAVCACPEGFGDATCSTALPPPDAAPVVVVGGAEQSFAPGETRALTATSTMASVFTWQVLEGQGCFVDASGGCRSSIVGQRVMYRAPTTDDEIEVTLIKVSGGSGANAPATKIGIITALFGIPVNGYGDTHLDPILQAVMRFMRYRCVGAATVGVARYGKPIGVWGLGRMNGRAAAFGWDPACGDDLNSTAGKPVPYDEPFPIGSVSKYHTFAMVRWALKKVALDQGGIVLTDEQIEGMKLFDPNNYPPLIPGTNPAKAFPVAIFPKNLYDIFSGKVPYPVKVTDSAAYNKTDVAPLCADLNNGKADPQWQEVTIGNIMGHTAGLQRSAPSYETVVSSMAALRGLTNETAFANQESILRNEWGNAAVDGAKQQLAYPNGTKAYFVPPATLSEILAPVAGRCLRFERNVYNYSNTDPTFTTAILEMLTGSHRFTADVGKPETHAGSALAIFLQTQLGMSSTASDNIFPQQAALGVPNYQYRGATKRSWSVSQNTYYPTTWDEKRPHCVWTGSACAFGDWSNATIGRVNWTWQLAQVPFPYDASGLSPGTGSFQVEALQELKVMAKYWVSGYGATPSIGEPRNNTWNKYTVHNGSLGGGYAYAIQLGSGAPKSWNLPPLDAQGYPTGDFANLVKYVSPIQLPNGVDIFVALAQNNDKKCLANGSCTVDYSLLNNFTLFGASKVDWTKITTTPDVTMPNN